MSTNYGILISAPGADITSASAAQQLFNSGNPFLKIDTQNPTGFQTMLLLITTEPPYPAVGNDGYTVVAKYKHGYTYPPALTSLFYVVSTAVTGYYQQYAMSTTSTTGITLSAVDPGDMTFLYAVADATYVYYIVHREYYIGTAMPISGTTVRITTQIYVEDVPTT